MKKSAFVLALLAASAGAQPIKIPPVRTVATLGSCSSGGDKLVIVTDGLTASDCTVGGGSSHNLCMCNGTAWVLGGGTGTVTSIGLTLPSWLTVSGSPVTTSGTLAVSATTGQSQNHVLATPDGSSGALSLRALVAADVPALSSLSGSVTDAQVPNDITVNSATAAGSLSCSDCVALGTQTTGGYAASVSEAGPATTATALAANGANCSAGSYPLGVDASGAAESCTAAITGPGSSTANGIVTWSGTAGAALLSSSTVELNSNNVLNSGNSGLGVNMYVVGAQRFLRQASEYSGPYDYFFLSASSSPNGGSGGNIASIWKGSYCFTAGSNAENALDTCLSRPSAGVLSVDTAASSNGVNGNGLGNVFSGQATLHTANEAQWIEGSASELLTLSTSGATTDTTANLLPANSIIEAVVARVTTTITTATDWKLGDATTAGRFSGANSTMTAGTTQVGTVHADQTGSAGPRQVAAAKVRVTTTGTPGAGAIRITVFYRQFVPPTS